MDYQYHVHFVIRLFSPYTFFNPFNNIYGSMSLMCLYVCVCVYVCVYLCECVCVSTCMCMFGCFRVSLFCSLLFFWGGGGGGGQG